MNNSARYNFPRGMLLFIAISLVLSEAAMAQTTLEYGALVGGVTAATEAKKEKSKDQDQGESRSSSGASGLAGQTMSKLYGESSQVMLSKTSSLLGQVGGGGSSEQTNSTVSKEITAPAQKTKIIESDEKDSTAVPQAPSSSPSDTEAGSSVKVHLKSGSIIQGKKVEQKDGYIKIDTSGIVVTYFNEEIEQIE